MIYFFPIILHTLQMLVDFTTPPCDMVIESAVSSPSLGEQWKVVADELRRVENGKYNISG